MNEWTHWYTFPGDKPCPARILKDINRFHAIVEIELTSGKIINGTTRKSYITPMQEDNAGYSILLYREEKT